MSGIWRTLATATLLATTALPALAQGSAAPHWVVAWTGSAQGPYPVGNPSAQPDLRFAFPPPANGAHDQTFRLMVRPDIWGPETRLRFTNAFGTRPVTFDGVFLGLQATGGVLVAGTNHPVRFGGKPSLTLAPGQTAWSDPVPLAFVHAADPFLTGRRLAVSFHVPGDSGPMTWHAKALTTSYVSPPGSGSLGSANDDLALPYSTASWYFLDALDMAAPPTVKAIVAFGDSITDGTASTMNGDDRWPDVLSHRLHAAGMTAPVVDEGIGGNRIVGPAVYGPDKPFAGGPAAAQRLDRDLLTLSSVGTVIWLEGINDFGKGGEGTTPAQAEQTLKELVAKIRAHIPGVRIIGATLTPDLGSTNPEHGAAPEDEERKAFNAFVRAGGVFDAVVDFDKVALDPQTGGMRAEFIPESTTGGPGDKLHPNRAGYQGMGKAIDLALVGGGKTGR